MLLTWGFFGVLGVVSLMSTAIKKASDGNREPKDKDKWSLEEELFLCNNQDQLIDYTQHNHPVKVRFGSLANLVNEAFHKRSPLQYKFHTAEQVSVKLKNMRSAVKAVNNAVLRIKHSKPPGFASEEELTQEQEREIKAAKAKCRFYNEYMELVGKGDPTLEGELKIEESEQLQASNLTSNGTAGAAHVDAIEGQVGPSVPQSGAQGEAPVTSSISASKGVDPNVNTQGTNPPAGYPAIYDLTQFTKVPDANLKRRAPAAEGVHGGKGIAANRTPAEARQKRSAMVTPDELMRSGTQAFVALVQAGVSLYEAQQGSLTFVTRLKAIATGDQDDGYDAPVRPSPAKRCKVPIADGAPPGMAGSSLKLAGPQLATAQVFRDPQNTSDLRLVIPPLPQRGFVNLHTLVNAASMSGGPPTAGQPDTCMPGTGAVENGMNTEGCG